jgi:phenylalanyl-tRNA synthetase beta chain
MNVSARWIRDLVPGLSLTPDEMSDLLALRGAPVESVTSPGEGLDDVVIGRVLTAEPHPDADRLTLCTVEGGEGAVQVVCGAPNVRAGAFYPFAPVGAILPGDFKIKKAKIRGQVSQGMLCSAKELGLGTDHSGILELEGEWTPGDPFAPALGLDDATLDVEVTANRGDLLSHAGVARELAGEGGGRVELPELPGDPGLELTYDEGAPEVGYGPVSIRIEDPDLCSRYIGVVIRGVRVGPSPAWLQERLRGAGARPINNVVDATNYVMLELGHPLHAFDLAKLRASSIVVRRPRDGEERFTTLDDEEREITGDMLMICDAERPVAIAGVMGGLESEVDEATADVLLECALFEPKSIRSTRKELVMSTDASYRFERGVDPEGARTAAERCAALIVATAGGAVDGPGLDCCPVGFEPDTVELRLGRVETLLGVAFDAETVAGLLAPLGFEVTGERDGTLQVRVPGYRSYDVRREVDLIEEVARTHGYDAFPSELKAYRPGTVPDDPVFRNEDELRRALAARGLFEAHTPAFSPEGEGEVEVNNPLSTRERFMRRTIVPALLRRVEHNFARGNRDVRLFEIGTSFRSERPGHPPVEATHLAAVLTGRRSPPHWSSDDDPFTVWDLKSILEEVAGRAYGTGACVEPGAPREGPFEAGTTFTAVANGAPVGEGGRVVEDAVDAPVWAGDVWALEVTLPSEVAPRAPAAYRALPTFPAVERDLALLVPDGVTSAQVIEVIRDAGGALLEAVELFDVYRGDVGAEVALSLAFRLRFRAAERTLKDKEVDKAVHAVLRRLEEELVVKPRG